MDIATEPTAGLRRLRRGQSALIHFARSYEGLPEDVTKIELLQKLKDAAKRLGIRRRVVELIELLVMTTSACDWVGDYAPISWASNDYLQLKMGLERSAVQNAIRDAQRAGLVLMQDSDNGRRYGHRDRATGMIRGAAFGFNLAPLAVRYEEFADHASALYAEIQALTRLRRAVTRDRRKVRAMARDALDRGLEGYDWARAMDEAATTDTRKLKVAALQALADDVRDFREAVENAWLEAQEAEQNKPQGSENRPLYIPTTHLKAEATYQEPSEDVVAEGVAVSLEAALMDDVRSRAEDVRIELVLSAVPELHPYLPNPDTATWSDLREAAGAARVRLGISTDLWLKAQRMLGGDNAAAAVAVTYATWAEGRIHRSAGGFLRGMVDAAVGGRLHLRASLYGLAERAKCAESVERFRRHQTRRMQ